MPGIIGKKLGMTSVFDDSRKNIPVTLVQAGPCAVTDIREYGNRRALQLGYGSRKEKNTSAALLGHFKRAGVAPKAVLKEFVFNEGDYELGQELSAADLFEEGDFVSVGGTSKGKGFQGVVKRHGFAGVGGETHGQHNRQRAPGALGGCSTPSRVFKGMKMGGRMGNDTVQVQNLRVLRIIPEKNILVVSGAVPGAKGGYLYITK